VPKSKARSKKLKQVELRLPLKVIERIVEVARLAGVSRTQALNVILASELLRAP
jgi:hypothetical protein